MTLIAEAGEWLEKLGESESTRAAAAAWAQSVARDRGRHTPGGPEFPEQPREFWYRWILIASADINLMDSSRKPPYYLRTADFREHAANFRGEPYARRGGQLQPVRPHQVHGLGNPVAQLDPSATRCVLGAALPVVRGCDDLDLTEECYFEARPGTLVALIRHRHGNIDKAPWNLHLQATAGANDLALVLDLLRIEGSQVTWRAT
jgi:hypothetical protein